MRSGNGGACLLTWAVGLQNLTLNTLLKPYRRVDSLSLSTPSYAASTRGVLLTLPCPANTYASWMVLSSWVPRHDGAPCCALPSPSFWTSSLVTLYHNWNDLMSALSLMERGKGSCLSHSLSMASPEPSTGQHTEGCSTLSSIYILYVAQCLLHTMAWYAVYSSACSVRY